jgi:F420-non-reducing hydrogenase small subunit
MSEKQKIAFYWCASCGGCEESIIDLAQDILQVAGTAEIVFWPVAMDFKYADVMGIEDDEIAVTLINGSIRTDEQEHMARVLRKKSKWLMAHGSCAHLGGVVGLANLSQGADVLRRSYEEVPSVNNPEEVWPQTKTLDSGRELTLPGFHNTVRSLDQTVEVDYYIPGCPPTPELVKEAIMMVLENRLPPRGSVLADRKALCDTCPRRESRPDKVKIVELHRVHEVEWDPQRCFLDQGIICLGPATRGGCMARCIRANMPCRGCFGPTDNVMDQGAKCVSFLAAILDVTDEKELEKMAETIPDPAGLFYRYSLPSSLLKRKASS